jgi:hypothetical protein
VVPEALRAEERVLVSGTLLVVTVELVLVFVPDMNRLVVAVEICHSLERIVSAARC